MLSQRGLSLPGHSGRQPSVGCLVQEQATRYRAQAEGRPTVGNPPDDAGLASVARRPSDERQRWGEEEAAGAVQGSLPPWDAHAWHLWPESLQSNTDVALAAFEGNFVQWCLLLMRIRWSRYKGLCSP
jgi:hypothetical protein